MPKGGRQAKMAFSYTQVELKKPRKVKGSTSIRVSVIQCQAVSRDDSPKNSAGNAIRQKR